jgi:putative MATE family efflux protein
MTKDLTEGKTISLILGFSIPVLFGYIFQQFYNIVDTVIVGKCLGVDALAAVGSTGAVNFLIIGFVMGVCSGFSIPVAQKFGAKDYKTMRQFAANAAVLAILFAAIMTIVTVIFCRPLLVLMLTPVNILDGADEYIRIIFMGIPMIFLYNMVSGIIRAVGDSKTPVIFLVLASILNIGLDLAFILVFNMGVGGAALATVISQGVSGAASLIYLIKKFPILTLSKDDRRIRTNHFTTLCGVGVPMGLQYSITAIGSVILQSSVNFLGSDAVASVTAGSKIGMFFCTPFDALGTTMATYGGQNAGAGKLERLKSGVFQSSMLGLFYSAAAFIIMYLWGAQLSVLFIDSSAKEIIRQARLFLIINSLFYFPLALVNIIRFMIQGMGFSKFAILSGIFEMIARTLIAVIAVPVAGFSAVCYASPAAWIMADFFLIPAFLHCWKQLEIWEKKHNIR